MTDHWQTIKRDPPIDTTYPKWVDTGMWYPCVNCDKRTSLHVVLDGIPPTPFCSTACMGDDVRTEVLESKVSTNAIVSVGAPVASDPGPDTDGQEVSAQRLHGV